MTYVLVIGSSHVAAYRAAAEAFTAMHPGITLSFFGVRGPLFFGGRVDKAGVFKVPLRDDKDRAFVKRTNGTTRIDTTGADHLLMVGHRFAFPGFPVLLEDHDILEGIRTGRPRLLSEAMLTDTIETMTADSVAGALRQVARATCPVTFAPAPYPATSITDRRDSYDTARTLEAYWARPDAALVFDLWRESLRRHIADSGHHLLKQPESVTAAPYATQPQYATRAAVLDQNGAGAPDHRHMNADFGLAMLRHFAETRINATSERRTMDQETTKERIA